MRRQCLFVARSVLAATLISLPFLRLCRPRRPIRLRRLRRTTCKRSKHGWLRRINSRGDCRSRGARRDAYSKLAYESGHTGELASARAAATKVTNPQSGIYALTFVARQYHKQVDADNAATLLKAAQAFADRTKAT